MIKEMTQEQMKRANTQAFLLERQLRKTVRDYFTKRSDLKDILPETWLGATNLMAAGILVNTCADKQEALDIFYANADVMRNIIEQTPDDSFAGRRLSIKTKTQNNTKK